MYAIKSNLSHPLKYSVIASNHGSFGDKVTAIAVFQKCGDANANGHAFPKDILTRAVEKIRPEVKSRHFLGELDHPEDITDVNRIATVLLKDASHVITELEMDGNYVVGKFETLNTPNGATLAGLLRDNIKVGVSIRAVTEQDISYGTDNIDTIKEFSLVAYDAVHNPAYSDSYVKSIVSSIYKLDDNFAQIRESKDSKQLITLTTDELNEIIAQAVATSVKKCYIKNKLI